MREILLGSLFPHVSLLLGVYIFVFHIHFKDALSNILGNWSSYGNAIPISLLVGVLFFLVDLVAEGVSYHFESGEFTLAGFRNHIDSFVKYSYRYMNSGYSIFALYMVVEGALATPIIEEIIFRGCLYTDIKRFKKVNLKDSMLIVSAAFSLFHVFSEPMYRVFLLFFMSYTTCIFVNKFRSIVPGIIVHSIYNGIWIFVALFEW